MIKNFKVFVLLLSLGWAGQSYGMSNLTSKIFEMSDLHIAMLVGGMTEILVTGVAQDVSFDLIKGLSLGKTLWDFAKEKKTIRTCAALPLCFGVNLGGIFTYFLLGRALVVPIALLNAYGGLVRRAVIRQ